MKKNTHRIISCRKAIGIVFCYYFLAYILNSNMPSVVYVKAADKAPTRVINVVYDDSGSMYHDFTKNQNVDTWCQAKYSMEVFAAMLGEEDTLNVYYMSDYENNTSNPPRITLKGKDGADKNVKKIHDEKTEARNTKFNTVRKAMADLSSEVADEKWLVILTDGAFEDGAMRQEEIDSFLLGKNSDISVMFLAMGPDAAGIIPHVDKNIFYVEAKTNSDILNQITGICNRIFNSNRLEVSANTKKFSFDVPMGELIVFAQGANVEINGIKTDDGRLIKSAKSPVEVKYSECDANNYITRFKIEPTKDLLGSIATFIDDFPAGNYSLDVSGSETIEIFYKPNVEIAAYLIDEKGNEVTDMSNLAAGEYTLTFGFVKAGTRERVAESKLLGKVVYDATVMNNGELHPNTYHSGDKLSLKEGSLFIEVTASYLDYNKVSTRLDYSIYRDKMMVFAITHDPTFTIISEGIQENDFIEIDTRIDGKELTPEQWKIMNVPEVRLNLGYRNFKINEPRIEKTNEVGVFRIYISLPGNKPSTGTYEDCNYSLSYKQKLGSETWSGSLLGKIKLIDTRSWWERNWNLAVKLVISLIILILLAGYLPLFKHYLPKGLKKKPYIKCRSSEPGVKGKERSGTFEKNFMSTIVPYVPQRGIIKYVPKGETGAPPLSVKAIKRHRMSVTNIKVFAGKDYITFDGEAMKAGTTKFETGAAVTIRVKRGEWTFTCNPNQASKH